MWLLLDVVVFGILIQKGKMKKIKEEKSALTP